MRKALLPTGTSQGSALTTSWWTWRWALVYLSHVCTYHVTWKWLWDTGDTWPLSILHEFFKDLMWSWLNKDAVWLHCLIFRARFLNKNKRYDRLVRNVPFMLSLLSKPSTLPSPTSPLSCFWWESTEVFRQDGAGCQIEEVLYPKGCCGYILPFSAYI